MLRLGEKSLVYRRPRVSEDLKPKGLFLLLGPRQYVRGLLIDDTRRLGTFPSLPWSS